MEIKTNTSNHLYIKINDKQEQRFKIQDILIISNCISHRYCRLIIFALSQHAYV